MNDIQRLFKTYHETVERNEYIKNPVWPKQQYFLLNSDVPELFYGGAGGGGKSYALLFGALQYVHVPNYSAIIFRKTLQDLELADALINVAKQYLHGTPARWISKRNAFVFPSGATVTFAYLQHEADKFRYRGPSFQYIGFDELTLFSETQYTYLFTRLRKPNSAAFSKVPLRMRSTSNPGGPGHAWVKKRFINPRTRQKGAMFIPAKMTDNGSLDIDGYRQSLSNTDATTRLQIEEGLWDTVAGGRFKRENFQRYHWDSNFIVSDKWRFDPMHRPRVLTCDWNASTKTSSDYTVISDWCLSPTNDLVWLECERFHAEIPEIIPAIGRHVRRWRPGVVGIEAVAANNAVAVFCERMQDPVMNVRRMSPMGKDKLVRATPAMIRTERKEIYLPDMTSNLFPLDDVETELVSFTGTDEDANDDIVDTLSYAAELLPYIEQTGARPVETTAGVQFGGGIGQRFGPTQPGLAGMPGPRREF